MSTEASETNQTAVPKQAPDAQTAAVEKLFMAVMQDNRMREKNQRRDVWFKRIVIGLVASASLGGYYLFLSQINDSGAVKTTKPTLAVVQVRGAIMPDSKTTSGGKVSAAIMSAAKDENVKEIVLYIESPGGAPVEAERIMQAVQTAREVHKKPVTAVIGNLGASAGYMVALSADKIVSGKFSLVGSIGAVINTWQVDGLLQRLDVKARSYTSGDLKAMLNPFEPVTEKGAAKAQELVDTLGHQFADLVKTRRAGKLTQDIQAYTSGEIWNGEVALKLGLVDANGTLESTTAAKPELAMVNFGPFEYSSIREIFVGTIQDGISLGVKSFVESQNIHLLMKP